MLTLFDDIEEQPKVSLTEVFDAYYACRKNKRNKPSAVEFELNLEDNLIQLWQEINDLSYEPKRSICFIVEKPVKREIFAANFRDRIIHHLLINKTMDLFEASFITDSYACRKNKGMLYGQKRVFEMIKDESENYTKDCYILKLDIRAFFMSIDKVKLFQLLKKFLKENYKKQDLDVVLFLYEKVIFNDPTIDCEFRSWKQKWNELPSDKSLFTAQKNKGLAIGNLTSQVLANFYMNVLDQFVKHNLKIKNYARYVDDFIIIHKDKKYLIKLIAQLKSFLKKQMGLILHPKKIYLQHYSKGVAYIGAYIKKYRICAGRRIIKNFNEAVNVYNKFDENLNFEDLNKIMMTINSYLGFLQHYSSFKVKRHIVNRCNVGFMSKFKYRNNYNKINFNKTIVKKNKTNLVCEFKIIEE
ncbi:MAG: RNA-directed DNA polymerase [Alphaproteobacteria bacterium]